MFNIVSVAMLLNQQERSPTKYCYARQKSTANRLISVELGHWTLNARKYVRCARTFYLLSSDIRSEGSIAIVKKIDFDFFFVIFDSTSLPQSRNVF